MSEVFSEYVRRLTASGEPPDLASYDEAREHLRALVVTELRRRGLWTSPPGYVGVTAGSWHEDGALDELVSDAYTFIFLRRLRGLADQLKVRPNIRGLIVRNVRNFLTERQRKADPLGYRIFVRLRAAVERLLELGRLFLRGLAGGGSEPEKTPAVGNATVLAFTRELTPVADAWALEGPVAEWNNRLMPDLVTAESRAVSKVVERLADEVATLPEAGVRAFRFQQLAKALKDDARARWRALWHQLQETAPEDGEPGAPEVPVVRPDETPDWPRFRARVLGCVEEAIGATRKPKRQRDLWQLWLFVRSTRVDVNEARELPNYSEIGRELGMPRARVSQLLDQLKQLVRRCLACAGVGPARTTPTHEGSAGPAAAEGARVERRKR